MSPFFPVESNLYNMQREQQVHNVNHEIAISLDKYTNCPLSGTEIAELTQPLRRYIVSKIYFSY